MPEFKDDGRLYAPAALRNRAALIALLRRLLPVQGRVLEIASGTGEHAIAFAAEFPRVIFQPSDPDPAARASIAAWIAATRLGNIAAPLNLDARDGVWKVGLVEAVLCINLLHLAPRATDGLLGGASQVLRPGGFVLVYGPFEVAARGYIEQAALGWGFGVTCFPMPEAHVALLFRKPQSSS
jgi:SAM-dependent methyltransferase